MPNDFISIISTDTASQKAYVYDYNDIKSVNIVKHESTKSFISSYIYTKDIISAIIQVSRSVVDSDLADTVENKAYEELGLDISIEYLINFHEIEKDGSPNREIYVFAINKDLVYDSFAEVVDKTKYIDFVSTPAFMLGALYQNLTLDSIGVQCFVYLQSNDAFVAIYKDGKYIYSKSINFSLHQICEKLSKIHGLSIDQEKFNTTILRDGLTDSQFQDSLSSIYRELFLYLGDIIIFVKRSYNIDIVNDIYFGTEFGKIDGIENIGSEILYQDIFDFNFTKSLSTKESYIDQVHLVQIMTSAQYLKDSESFHNFTIFQRPPPFINRDSGKLIISIVASLLVVSLYPLGEYIYALKLKYDSSTLNTEYKSVREIASKTREELDRLKLQKREYDAQMVIQNERFMQRKKILDELQQKKVNYTLKSMKIFYMANIINKNKIKVEKIKELDNAMIFSVLANSEKDITEAVKEISIDNSYHISFVEVYKDEITGQYKSDLIMKVK